MKRLINSIFLIAIFVLYLGCCKDEPCQGVQEVKASFKSDNYPLITHKYLKPSYVNYNYTLQFQTAGFVLDSWVQWDSLEWRIGGEKIYNKTSFYRTNIPPGKLDVTLIVKKKPNKSCYPNDDGIDTLTQTYQIIEDFDKENRIVGTYRGKFIDFPLMKDSFEFKVYLNRIDDFVIDTFPFMSCREALWGIGNNLNEVFFVNEFGYNCNPKSQPFGVGVIYLRNIDNHSRNIELILNPVGYTDDNKVYHPPVKFLGYRK
ncbi:MAG: hypothetical protein JNL75_05265 [Chitinophagales bacterium]|nr:hypothetical protein [Chitinophagales bacterium]